MLETLVQRPQDRCADVLVNDHEREENVAMRARSFVSIAALATFATGAGCLFPSKGSRSQPALPQAEPLAVPAELGGATELTIEHGLGTQLCKFHLVPEGSTDRGGNWLAKPLDRDGKAKGRIKPGSYTIVIELCGDDRALRRKANIDRTWTIHVAYDRYTRLYGEDGTHSDGHETWGWNVFYLPTPPSEMPRAYSPGPSSPGTPSEPGGESQPEPQRDCVPSGAVLPPGKQCCYGTFTTGPGGQETCT